MYIKQLSNNGSNNNHFTIYVYLLHLITDAFEVTPKNRKYACKNSTKAAVKKPEAVKVTKGNKYKLHSVSHCVILTRL